MRAFASVVTICSLSLIASAGEDSESVTFSATVAGHRIQATLSSKPFDSKRHKITSPAPESGESVHIDGKRPIGIDRIADAQTEFSRFEISWDGKVVLVPRSLYSDCFNPNLRRKEGWWDDKNTVYFLPSQDASSLLIQMQGSDGEGSYFASWVITSNGKHSRFIDEEIP